MSVYARGARRSHEHDDGIPRGTSGRSSSRSRAKRSNTSTPAGGAKRILLGGRHYVMEQAEIDRLAVAGVRFAYLIVHEMPDETDRVMTVPVN